MGRGLCCVYVKGLIDGSEGLLGGISRFSLMRYSSVYSTLSCSLYEKFYINKVYCFFIM